MSKQKPHIKQAEIVRKFGVMLRERRISVGMTQAQLAFKAGVTSAHVWRLESGSSAPGIDLVEQLATALGVPISKLLPEQLGTESLVVFRDQAKELFDAIIAHGGRDTYVVLNPLLACLVESMRRRS